jgi:hypothetical protein
VRVYAYAAWPLLALVLTGCGGEPARVWEGPPPPTADGRVAVASFDGYLNAVDETWEGSAEMAAARFVRLDRRASALTSIEAKSAPEGSGPAVVTVTLDGIPDDSVRAERWVLSFSEDGDAYTLTGARRVQRCRAGRGHETFNPQPCV